MPGGPFPGVFIRAPAIEAVGEAVEVLAEHDGHPVLRSRRAGCGSRRSIPSSRETCRVHELFLEEVAEMSGHSKWHSIKHAKGAADAARGKLFARLARQIEVAARVGRRRHRRATRRCARWCRRRATRSMPKDNIERAIKRGTGELEGVTYEEVNYEGYAPNGVAVFVETLTDNRNRTGSEIKNVFTRNGGSLAEPGAVSWQFERKGVIILAKAAADEDDLMLAVLEAGAEDIEDQGDTWQVTTPADRAHAVRTALEAAGHRVHERRPHDAPAADRPARGRRQREAGAARHRRARGARRRAERLRQLRHPRRRPPRP